MTNFNVNATAASLLGFLHERPMAGWDLVATAQQRIGNFWSLTKSQVYRELSTLARAGLIEAGERGPRERQPYTITQAGRDAFREWVLREPDQETIRFPLLLTVMFGEHLPPEHLAVFLASHRERHAARLEMYEEQHAGIPEEYRERNPFSVATLEFGIAYERAALEWFDNLPASIRNPVAGRREDFDCLK